MKRCCIIVAGGVGRRMAAPVPKQFISIGGRPVLMHTIDRFASFDPQIEIVVVLPAEHISYWKEQTELLSFTVPHTVVAGGEERFYSVKEGLRHVSPGSVVAIHDGVRPLVSHDTIRRCFDDALTFDMAIPFIGPADSVRIETGEGSHSIPRSEVRLIQTPQVFRAEVIMKAYEQQYDPSFTDDASVAEAAGFSVHLTPGNRENIKITTPEDIIVAGAFLAQSFGGM